MAIIRQIEANKDFSERVQGKFKVWCSKKGKPHTEANFVKYLVRHGFIKPAIINRFLSIELFNEELPKTATKAYPKGRKLITIYNLEDKLPIHQTQIRSNVYFHARYFKDRSNRFP